MQCPLVPPKPADVTLARLSLFLGQAQYLCLLDFCLVKVDAEVGRFKIKRRGISPASSAATSRLMRRRYGSLRWQTEHLASLLQCDNSDL